MHVLGFRSLSVGHTKLREHKTNVCCETFQSLYLLLYSHFTYCLARKITISSLTYGNQCLQSSKQFFTRPSKVYRKLYATYVLDKSKLHISLVVWAACVLTGCILNKEKMLLWNSHKSDCDADWFTRMCRV